MPGRPKKERPQEAIKLKLDTAATPERVEEVAAMFAATLSAIDPDLTQGEVTMVVNNFTHVNELRGWKGGGAEAVSLLGQLVDNATEAVQEHSDLATAARTLADHATKLARYKPTFWRGRKKIRAVDDVFIRTMRAAGDDALKRQAKASGGSITGDTVVYSPVLRVGRKQEGSQLRARVRVDGRFGDFLIADGLVDDLFEAAKTGRVCQLRLRGIWIEDDAGDLHLSSPTVVEMCRDYAPKSGHEFLEAAKDLSDVFEVDEFQELLDSLEVQPEDMG